VTDQQDDIEDDVDAPKCKACGVSWTRHQGIIAICQQYLETVETLERVTKERDAARRERDLAIRLNGIEETGRIRIENAWRSERDEARRWVCQAGLFSLKMAKEVAARRGWDCYKEETQ
jgi:uncharacterized Zn finger protein (UPF0148 family)